MYVVEWSKKQNSYHTQTLERMVEYGKEIFKQNKDTDWTVIAVTYTLEQAYEITLALIESRNAAQQNARETEHNK